MNEEKTVEAVINETHDLLVRHNYSANDIAARYTRIWKRFKTYAAQQGKERFSTDLADRYLSETYHFPQEYDVVGTFPSEVVNEISAIRSLRDCYLYGTIASFLKPKREYVSVHFSGIYSSYRANRSGYGRSKESIAQYMRTAENFLDFVEGCGVTDCRNITSEMIDRFIVLQQCYTKHAVKMKLRTANVFFRYLFEERYVDTDFSYRAPNVTIFRKGHIPTTLTSEQYTIREMEFEGPLQEPIQRFIEEKRRLGNLYNANQG